MKLPEKDNIYNYNQQLDELVKKVAMLCQEYNAEKAASENVAKTLLLLKQMSVIICHLELVLDEVVKKDKLNNARADKK